MTEDGRKMFNPELAKARQAELRAEAHRIGLARRAAKKTAKKKH